MPNFISCCILGKMSEDPLLRSSELLRSYSLDSDALQRPPSSTTVRNLVRQQSRKKEESIQDSNVNRLLNVDTARKVEFSPSCIECVKPYPVLDADDIQEGDHIIYIGAVYDHHAIVTSIAKSKNKCKRHVTLIHASNTRIGAALGASSLGMFGGKAKILTKTDEVDFKQTKTMVVKYLHNRFSPAEIVKRATDQLQNEDNENVEQFKYHLFENNCEHFATWCITGKKFSVQVRKIRMVKEMFMSGGLKIIRSETERNKAAFDRDLLCESCFKRNEKLFSVEKRQIMRPEDVGVGDIITFRYYFLSHDAVVLDIDPEYTDHTINATIAHYAFLGPFTHRTIKREQLPIRLDGSVTVTDYSKPLYTVYPPEEVVSRAKSRIGEQMFAFFANDSSHFARWCKLTLLPFAETSL